jgi:two-component system, response regulator PdtaR
MAHAPTERPVVLIVEDEFLVRMYAAEMINDAGYDVVEAINADHAIAILESRRDIRVVFTDIQLPGSMDGLKLAQAVRNRWPPVHIIATSAYHRTLQDDLPIGSVFLPKPYSERNIIGTLQALAGVQLP